MGTTILIFEEGVETARGFGFVWTLPEFLELFAKVGGFSVCNKLRSRN